jgi:hypothetical protein
MPKRLRETGETHKPIQRPDSTPLAPRVPELRHDRRPPVPDEQIINRLNELLEAERAGVEAVSVLRQADHKGVTDTELKKFAEDEWPACAGLSRAILRYRGQPSNRTGDFGRRVASLKTEGECLNLMARGQAWVVKRLDALLDMPLNPETQAFLVEMREEHRENIDACNRRAEEISAPPSPPYRELEFAHLREGHDRLYYGACRGPTPTEQDAKRAYLQMGRYLGALADEVQRARSIDARRYLGKARSAYAKADPVASGRETLPSLDRAFSYAHSALNALLLHARASAHDPRDFESFYDMVGVPFQDLI